MMSFSFNRMILLGLALLHALAVGAPTSTISSPASSLPIVDLGYTVHRATLNSSDPYPYYNFSNIRFGKAPVGDLRFQASLPPSKSRNKTVNDGQQGVICPQATPGWIDVAGLYLTGTTDLAVLAAVQAEERLNRTPANIPAPDPRTSEDCLFLDVIVPTAIYDSTHTKRKHKPGCKSTGNGSTGAPVIIWIFGGGYTSGDKTNPAAPAGLLSESEVHGGIIFVAMNYRLGLFGFLAGEHGITPNGGILDQRLAMEWVQEYIHLFGGDPNQVTIMGESSGGGSVLYHITAYGGNGGKLPFQTGIFQSPATNQPLKRAQQRDIYQKTLAEASSVSSSRISTVQELKSLSFENLYATNYMVVGNSDYGSFTYNPGPDGFYVPDFPSRLLSEGRFDHSISIMVGHNINEGAIFSSPFITTQADYVTAVEQIIPSASQEVIAYVTETLYPNVLNGSFSYTTQNERFALTLSDLYITCNTRFLALAFNGLAYSYLFSVPPGYHGVDVAYTFYDGPAKDEGYPVNATLAGIFQNYIGTFAATGSPNYAGLPYFPRYGVNTTVLNVNVTKLGSRLVDPMANQRCTYWYTTPYA
ncbi:Alpha/Beta hydrolase protein [Lipomyces starkeyi]